MENITFGWIRFCQTKYLSILKLTINNILPIALALILPGLSFYAEAGVVGASSIGVVVSWFFLSCLIYLFWYSLWFLWDVKSKYKQLGFILVPLFIFFFMGITLDILGIKEIDNYNLVHTFRFILAVILFVAIQYALKAQQNIAKLELEKEQVQTEHYKGQLKALRTKIDPHFLFNSLNTLRSMVRHQHANSEKFIISLSDFYRQTLKYNDNATIQLSEELTVLKSYLFLMKNRNEEAVSISLDIDKQLFQRHLPTLALQVIVENCFKHNSMTSKMPLQVDIRNNDEQYIVITNNIQPKIEEEETSGLGLDLLKKRYELMNIADGIIVEETPQHFTVKLKLI